MAKIDLKIHKDRLERVVQRARERKIIIPTFAQMKNPELIPADVKDKLAGVGLWDVLGACHRPGSLDASIRLADAEPRPLGALLDAHPRIATLAFNGAITPHASSSVTRANGFGMRGSIIIICPGSWQTPPPRGLHTFAALRAPGAPPGSGRSAGCARQMGAIPPRQRR